MKKIITLLLVSLILVLSSPAANAQVTQLVDKYISFSTVAAQSQFAHPVDISKYWVPVSATGTALAGSDSAWSFTWSSSIYNTAEVKDSSSIAIVMGLSNQFATPSFGYAGNTFDTLLVGTKYVKWFRPGTVTPILCPANADTIVVHAANTTDQTEVQLYGRIVSTSPKKYAYFRYTTAVTNSASNRVHHVVTVTDPNCRE